MNRIGLINFSIMLPMLLVHGCGRDQRLPQMQSDVTRAATELVQQDAQARREIMQMQASLDNERRLIAERERRDPIIAEAISQVGGLLLCLLPLAIIGWLLSHGRREDDVTVLDELLIDEVVEHEPKRLVHHDLDTLVQERLIERRD